MKQAHENINPLFTKENAQAIFVPDSIKDDLCSIIEEKLRKTGFYYRIAYRVKSPDSIVEKMIRRGYGQKGSSYENKKLQDLIGLRIIFYFDDDMSVVRTLLNSLFKEPGEWETTEITDYEFHAMKTNGTFRLPEYMSNMIVNPALKDYVDDTFEIQVRTNAFEGWHEVEHDLHYKGSAFTESSTNLSRRMNSILATLELCDDSLVKLLEDLGHQHYKDENWEDMIRCHYRIKFSSDPLSDKVISCFNENKELAKLFFKHEREKLLSTLWYRNTDSDVKYSVTDIVRIVNETGIKNEKLFEIFSDVTKKSMPVKRKKFEPFKQLGTFPVFASRVEISSEGGMIATFEKSCGYMYSWVKSRLSEVFTDLPEEVCNFNDEMPGYRIILKYDKDKMFFSEMTTHPDAVVANRMWISKAYIEEKNGKLILTVTNCFAEPVEKYRDPRNGLFSRPNFYGEIADNIGISDVDRLSEEAVEITKENIEGLYDLIYSGRRHFPVILFMISDKSWAEKFDINYFSFLVGYYAHVRLIYDTDVQSGVAKEYHLDEKAYADSITVFYPGEAPRTNYKKDILEASFEVIKYETKKYWNEKGCRAFRRRLIADIREKIVENVNDNVFKSDISFNNTQETEEWDIVDENGDFSGYTIERADAKHLKENMFHRVASIYVITKDKKVLITRRSAAKSHPGKWEITCGSVVSGESAEQGAVRELEEETGIFVKPEDLELVYKYADKKRHCVYYGFVIGINSSDTKIKLEPKETDKYEFISLKKFTELIKGEDFVRSESERFVIYEETITKALNNRN